MTDYRHYSKGDPELEAITAQWPSYDGVVLTLGTVRGQFEQRRKEIKEKGHTITNLTVEDFNIPVNDGEIMLRKYIPQDSGGNPLLIWYHGGGFIMGHPDGDDAFCRLTCVTHNISVVSVDYRLAPEHPFPVGFEDSYEALKWCAAHVGDLKADLTKGFIVGGASAGGNFSAALALKARDDPAFTSELTGQLLAIPNVITVEEALYPKKWKDQLLSYDELKSAPVIPRKIIDFFLECYACKDGTDWRRSPLLAPSHANLPRAVIQVAGNDPLRDEGIVYSKVLEESGVETKLIIYPAAFHGFHGYAAHTQLARKYNQDAQDGIKWLLSKQ